MTAAARASSTDQAFTLAFKLTLAAQAAAGLIFGLAPLLATTAYASALGFNGDLPLVYRLGGAATTGYFVAPVIALAWRAGWRQIRIPAIGAVVSWLAVLQGGGAWLAPVVAVAASFATVALIWVDRTHAS